MKVDPNNFDYVMYVDASGDDGFKFEKDSSVCYAAAALLVNREDIEHNLNILQQIKKIVGCKETDEIKYSKIRRHRRGDEAMQCLQEIKGRLSCHVVFKKELDATAYQGNKSLSVICHLMALHSLDIYDFSESDKVLLAIDRMKHSEEVPIEIILAEERKEKATRNFDIDVAFRDSKDAKFLLIQIADLLCGTIREHFEQYETNENMLYFKEKCPICIKMRKIKRGSVRPLCEKGKSKTAKTIASANFKNVFHLFPEKKSVDLLDFLFMEPPKMVDQHFYLICQRKK